jgi:hypothetical protein
VPLGPEADPEPELGLGLDPPQAASAAASSPAARTAPALMVLLMTGSSFRGCEGVS